MHHGESVKLGVDHAQKKKAKLGVWFFFLYSIIYAIFVIIGVFYYEKMGNIVLGSQNLAVVFGFGLIIFAVLLGIFYNWLATRYENKMNKEDKQ